MNQHRHPFTTHTARVLAAPAVVALGLVAAPASTTAAGEVPIACGTVITTDVRLTADLLDCPSSGLVVGASGITIDLAGHVIDGTGSGAGIDNVAGHDEVRITGGTVREFQFGIELFETRGARVDRVAAASNIGGVVISRSTDVEFDRVTATGSVGNGIDVTFSERVTVRRSTASDSGLAGIVDRFSQDDRYERNTATGNSSPGLVLNLSEGLVVERNHVAGNDSDGIELTGVTDAVLERNEAVGNTGHGIFIDEAGNTLAHNHAAGNLGMGIAAPEGTVDGGRNRATGNLGGTCTGVDCD